MNELTWMTWHEWIDTKELKWMNWNRWIKMRLMHWNEWIEIKQLKWKNWNEWIEMQELTWMNELMNELKWMTVSCTFFRPHLPKVLTLAFPFYSDIRMLQNDPTPGPEIDAKQKKRGVDSHTPVDPGVWNVMLCRHFLAQVGCMASFYFIKLSMASIHSIWDL